MSEIVLPAVVAVPFAGAVLAFVAGRRGSRAIGLLTAGLTSGVAALLVLAVAETGPIRHPVGGWGAPLGIDLAGDGLAAAMIGATAAIGVPVSVYAARSFPPGLPDLAGWTRASAFWPLWLFLWASLNALFVSGDAFNLYVALELVTLSAVGLVVLHGNRVALVAGLRYLLAAFFASLAYLVGVAFLYVGAETLDLALIAERLARGMPGVPAAVALMTGGLALKAAVFPLHFWLPDAHSRAPTPASAVLSGLVIMAALYLLVRLWFGVFPAWITGPGSQLVGIAGLAALAWGSIRAIRTGRLKLLLAWSTVAQVGLIVIALPVGLGSAGAAAVGPAAGWDPAAATPVATMTGGVDAVVGGAVLAVAHGLAKAALFLAAGLVIHAVGHDRLDDLRGIGGRLPLAVVTIALAGASLAGLPGTGGEAGKHLLAEVATGGGQWWWRVVLDASLLLTGAYVVRVLWAVLRPRATGGGGEPEAAPLATVPMAMQAAALVLALMAVGLGFVEEPAVRLIEAGLR